ncbi:MAG: S46 family peptidase [Phycisphaerae bacterium]|nr:S46 family peptidase [Phycisphaerae bacterium]
MRTPSTAAARPLAVLALIACTLFGTLAPAHADEGMWLINRPPLAGLKEQYKFEPTPQWLETMQKSSVRFATGGSGSLVSSQGLVLTNHHVGADMLAKLSTPKRDLLREGFRAATLQDELRCPDLALDILWTIEDVTTRVNAGATPDMDPAAAGAARRSAIAAIETASEKATGLKSEVVTLYQGGQYHLYTYRRFDDVRLVFAPEQEIAFFGGDTDNFEYPRFNLDCCFFRIYENGAPLKSEHHLRWSADGAAADELVFVFGHPGRTRRLYTLDHLRFMRDVEMPKLLAKAWRDEVKLTGFAARNEENARIASDDLHGIQNGRKARTWLLAGLQDPVLLDMKKSREDALRDAVARDETMRAGYGSAWDRVAQAQQTYAAIFDRYQQLENGWRRSSLARHARTIVRLVDEREKPSGERLREYADSRLDTVERALFSPEPIYDALEIETLTNELAFRAETFGGDDPVVTLLLDGKSPAARADELVGGCTLRSVDARKKLVEGGRSALESSPEPLIRMMLSIDNAARAVRTQYEDEVESVERLAYADIAAATFAIEGDTVYPDATFTLRMTFGPVEGWKEGGAMIAPFTTFAGLYQRHADRKGLGEFSLPKRWLDAKSTLPLDTPFNFVCSVDIIGGNSGSPVVNRKGELVGLIFDGNLPSLVGDVIYDGSVNRAVAVDSRGILTALDVVYGAKELVREIQGSKK